MKIPLYPKALMQVSMFLAGVTVGVAGSSQQGRYDDKGHDGVCGLFVILFQLVGSGFYLLGLFSRKTNSLFQSLGLLVI